MVENLNRTIWLEDDTLNPEVRSTLLKISEALKISLEEKLGSNMIPIEDIVFTGSLTGPNWDEQSDIDLHFLVDFTNYDDEYRALLEYYLLMFAGNFNENKYNILGYTVELYFQDKDEPHQTPGMYSIIDNKWIKEPEDRKIVFTDEEKKLADAYLDRINELKRELETTDILDYNLFYARLDDMMKEIKEMRARGMESADGMYSKENIVFKMLRRNGGLKIMGDLKKKVRKRIYSLMKECMLESIFVPLTTTQVKQRKDIYFKTIDNDIIGMDEAIALGWYERVEELLNGEAVAKYGRHQEFGKFQPEPDIDLMTAVENNEIEIVKLLLSYGANPRYMSNRSVRLALNNKNYDIVKLLMPKLNAHDIEILREEYGTEIDELLK